jgi:hypothetical protein
MAMRLVNNIIMEVVNLKYFNLLIFKKILKIIVCKRSYIKLLINTMFKGHRRSFSCQTPKANEEDKYYIDAVILESFPKYSYLSGVNYIVSLVPKLDMVQVYIPITARKKRINKKLIEVNELIIGEFVH